MEYPFGKNVFYEIEVINWDKYNASKKANHNKFFLKSSFFSDQKIRSLGHLEIVFFIGLLTICSEQSSKNVQLSSKGFAQMLNIGPKKYQLSLKNLVSVELIRVLSYASIDSLIKRREEKRREKKVITTSHLPTEDGKRSLLTSKKSAAPRKESESKEACARTWESYRAAYMNRYGVEPVRNARVNANVKQLVSRVGEAVAPGLMEFFLSHHDAEYIKACHQIGLALRDCEALRTQMLRGKTITRSGARKAESGNELVQVLNAIDRGEI